MIYGQVVKAYEKEKLSEAVINQNAMNLKEAMNWYDKFVKESKYHIDSKEDLQDRINLLKQCVRSMKKAKVTGKGRWKYAFNAIVPYNDICHFIKNKEAYINIENIKIDTIVDKIEVASDEVIESIKPENIGDTITDKNFQMKASKIALKTTTTVIGGPFSTIANVIYRASTYNAMLDKSIKETEEAIDFLENKLKEYK